MDGKVSKTGNDMDNLNKLKNKKYKFKSNIIVLKKKITQDRDNVEGYNDDRYEDTGYQFGRKHLKKKS